MKTVDWRSPLNIPEGKSGKYKIVHKIHPAGEEIVVVSMRTALFSGLRPEKTVFDTPERFHYLQVGTGVLMSDIPQEQYDHRPVAEKITGRVLVGGLGLGYIAMLLAQKKSVKEVVVVEISKDVIKLVAKHLPSKVKVVHSDIFKYLKNCKEKFDWVYLDTWSHDGEGTFYDTVVPMRVLARKVTKSRRVDRVICWKEASMRGQLRHNIAFKLIPPGDIFAEIMSMDDETFNRNFSGVYCGQEAFLRRARAEKVTPWVAGEWVEDVATYGEEEWQKVWGKWVTEKPKKAK